MPYKTINIPVATNGLNKDLQATQIPSASPNMVNMIVEPWGVRKRLGYSSIGKNLPLEGIGMELLQYTDARGSIHHIAITTTCIYQYDSSSRQWLPIMASTQNQDCEDDSEWTAGSDITLSNDATNYKEGSNSLKMEADDDISAGAKIAYTSTFDDSDDISSYTSTTSHIIFWFRASKAGVQITVHFKDGDSDIEALSLTATDADTWYRCCVEVDLSGIDTITTIEVDTETALVGGDYILIDDIRSCGSFSGDGTSRFSYTVATDTDLFSNNGGSALMFSNYIDGLYYFEGDSGDEIVELDITGTLSNFSTAKEVMEFWNHLFLLNYTDTGANVRSLAYSDLGDVDDYSAGTSDSTTLTDSIGKMMRAVKLGSEMIIYSAHSITTCRYLGDTPLFVFPTLVFETGLIAEGAIWGFVNVHYFLGVDRKIYAYAGGQHLIPIGNAIEDSLFDDLNASKIDYIVTGIHPSKHKLYFMYPSGSNTYADKAYAINYKRKQKAWEYHEFADNIRSFSLLDNKHDWYADGPELAGTCADELVFYADDSFTQSGYPTPTILTSDGYIMQMNEKDGSDNGSDIRCVYETMDLTVDNEEHYMRISWFSVNAMSIKSGGTFDLYYSTDGIDSNDASKSWTLVEAGISINTSWYQHRIPVDINARICRFKLVQNSNRDLRIRSMHCKITENTDRH